MNAFTYKCIHIYGNMLDINGFYTDLYLYLHLFVDINVYIYTCVYVL